MKTLLIICFALNINFAYSQNKKEQIEMLNSKIDQLKSINQSQSNIINIKEAELNKNQIQLENKQKEKIIFKKIIDSLIIENNKLKNAENKVVTIKYTNEINGFFVKVYWKPDNICPVGIRGSAFIEFYNIQDKTFFTLTADNFGMPQSLFPFNFFNYSEDSLEILNTNQHEITLFYEGENLSGISGEIGNGMGPFFFQDLDFDNIKELIIGECGTGQRFCNTYNVYGFRERDENYEGKPYSESYYGFGGLDGLSTIDYINKSITIHGSNGWCDWTDEIYNLRTSKYGNGEFVCETMIKHEYDYNSDKCYELKYKVVDKHVDDSRQLQLISKKEFK